MWDMLYHRYSNPMMLLDQYIQMGRFSEFISQFLKIHNDELKDKVQWEFYLHKVYDKSFSEYAKEIKEPSGKSEEADMNEIEATVKKSMNILDNFKI